jgi:hypothetical protein
MAIGNSVYGPVRADIEDGVVRLISDNLDCILVDSSLYTYSYDHHFLSSIATGNARAGTAQRLANKINKPSDTAVGGTAGPTSAVPDYGVFDASDITFGSVANPTGTATYEAVVCYKETGGAESGKILVFYYDTATSGLPVTPNGGDITVQWAEGNFRIFAM